MLPPQQQMLCIVSPDWPLTPADMTGFQPALDAVLDDVGVVHFASLALLPPMPGSGPGALPSLFLELVVEEGIATADILRRLVDHPRAALWRLYAVYWGNNAPPSLGQRNDALFQKLLEEASTADGAFVGVRDRTVRQIRQERELFNAVRAQAAIIPPAQRLDRRSFAAALRQWLVQQRQFEWALTPAPRSFWRTVGTLGKAASLVLLALCVPLALSLIVMVAQTLAWCAQLLWGLAVVHIAEPLGWACSTGCVSDAAGRFWHGVVALLDRSVLLVWCAYGLVLLIGMLYVLFGVVLTAASSRWRWWLTAYQRELDRPNDTWSSRATTLFAWMLVTMVLAALLFAVVAAVAFLAGGWPGLDPVVDAVRRALQATWVRMVLLAYAAVLGCLFVLLWFALTPSPYLGVGAFVDPWTRFKRWFHRPMEREVKQAQQVHLSIEECEASLVGGTAHMISLTEMRTPYGWSAFWTRLALGFVSFFGHVWFTEGSLDDAPGIQFGHWHVIDGGRRYLFCSNFDGTFGGYLDDFIKGPSTGTTLFWRWTHLLPRAAAAAGHPSVSERRSFPPTRLLMFRGVHCELEFKAYARASMVPHLYRYDACGLNMEQKMLATRLRDALAGPSSDVNDDIIMRALES